MFTQLNDKNSAKDNYLNGLLYINLIKEMLQSLHSFIKVHPRLFICQ